MKKTALIAIILMVAILTIRCTEKPVGNKAVMAIKVRGNGEGSGIAIDKKGNMYVVGSFTGTAVFGDTEIKTSFSSDLFLVKYDSSGAIEWFQTAGISGIKPEPPSSESNSTLGMHIALDSLGNIYIAGKLDKTARFGHITKTTDDTSPKAFIAKYNNKGQAQWVEAVSSRGHNTVEGLTIDKSGSIYLTGVFFDTLHTNAGIWIPKGEFDNFIAKYTNAGQLQWVESVKDKGNNTVLTRGLASDNNGNIYVAGDIRRMTPYGATLETWPFMARINGTGQLQWLQSTGETKGGGIGRILIDNNNDIYLMGGFSDSIKIGNTSLVRVRDSSSNCFVAKYNADGTPLWAKSFHGRDELITEQVALDKDNNLYVTGHFRNKIIFGETLKTADGRTNVFISKYNTNGTLQWLKTTNGNDGTVSRGMAVDKNNKVYITGFLAGKNTFENSNVYSAGRYENYVFIWRFPQ